MFLPQAFCPCSHARVRMFNTQYTAVTTKDGVKTTFSWSLQMATDIFENCIPCGNVHLVVVQANFFSSPVTNGRTAQVAFIFIQHIRTHIVCSKVCGYSSENCIPSRVVRCTHTQIALRRTSLQIR